MKTIQMNIRCSPDEKGAWAAAAEECGLSISDWVRIMLNVASRGDDPLLAQVRRLVTVTGSD